MRRMEMEINAEKLPLACPILLAKTITDNKYKSPNHIKYLERNILQALAQGKARVIINMPPRHGKSELLSKYLPAWYRQFSLSRLSLYIHCGMLFLLFKIVIIIKIKQ